MMNNSIRTEDDIQAIVDQSAIAIITTYRGDWCPFCRSYLSDFNRAYTEVYRNIVRLFAVSIDDEQTNEALKAKLGLDFEIYTDETRVFHTVYKVAVSNGHGKDRYLQPAIFVFQDGKNVFEWIQTPKLLNLGGASSRIPVKEIFEIVADLS